MTDDIVTRLRRFTANNADWPTIAEAADEIERLRADKEKCHDIMETQSHEIRRLVRNTGCARNQRSTQFCAEALDAQREAERLREERDEAVREAAQARQTIYRLQHELAGCSRAPADGKHTAAGESFIPEAL